MRWRRGAAVIISKKARDVPQAKAMDYVGGYALALDMTDREIQATAKVIIIICSVN
ncbi:putative acylpyruvate hydrolase [Rosa chinensis]|uniref:Putative acylpyruvate hydrolase n=1 Tax=Rosa chinensis TaxID=74649 RepID=A0A2P6SQ98_ROSCH|nr:putative acylpyruvate hydrolase [Rosa chinensis]